MDELTREFLIESQEGLDRMERCLTDLEERPQDAELIADIFRSVHTIKGTTGFLGFRRLEKLAHTGENLLGQLRDKKLTANQSIITCLLHLLDGLRSILKSVETAGGEGEGTDEVLIAELERLQVPAQAPAQAAAPKAEPVKAVAAAAQAAVAAPPAPPAAVQPPPAASLPPVAGAAAAEPVGPEKAGQEKAAQEKAAPPRPVIASAAESSLRVDVNLLNRMMNLVGELVLTRNQVLQVTAADPNLTPLSRRLDMVTSDLREAVMKARMQPVSNIFSKMPRIVRDLSQGLGRQVRLEVEGQETELDKSLIEAIKDPLTHAVRNSLDHGIEPPEARRAAGKNPEGLLRLRAAQEGSHVIIEVFDDGAGIAVDKIRQKAVERSLITAERAGQLTERELLQLIFLPGFSTAEAVTRVSGRGVGMDVVRTNVEKIGGKVEIDSTVGKGTTIRLRIPLTLAIIPALIVRCVNQSFALPQNALSELIHIPAEQVDNAIEWIEGAPLYRLRGNLLPLVFLDTLLIPSRERKLAAGRDNFVAVLEVEGLRYGLVVDSLADPEEIVVKPLSSVLKTIGIYSGATVLGNAELALILDPGAIAVKTGVRMSSTSAAERTAEVEASEANDKNIEYLLVEIAGTAAAVPLGAVQRIEQLPISRLEYIGSRPVINFGGQLLPVEDSGGVLSGAQGSAEAQVVIVVCRDGQRHVGIAVTHVLDVAAGSDLFEAGTDTQTSGVTLLKERVTGVVNLGVVADLPIQGGQQEQWQEFAERNA